MAKNLEEWWEKESLINRLFVQPLMNAAKLPGEVYRGEVSPYQMESEAVSYEPNWLGSLLGDEPSTEFVPAGGTNRELIDRSAEAGMSIPLAGMASRPAAGVLAANPFGSVDYYDDMLTKLNTAFPDMPISNKNTAEGIMSDPSKWIATLEHIGLDPAAAQKGYDEMTQELAESLPPLSSPSYGDPEVDEIFQKYLDTPISDPLAPKPLDTEAYPWLAKPVIPFELQESRGILDGFDPQFRPVRDELYRRGMSQEELIEIQRLAASNEDENLLRAHEMSSRLRSLLPEDWNYAEGTRYSTVVPHAVDTRGLLTEQIPGRMEDLLSRPDPENLARAREQGYDLDRVLFRGTRSPTDQFLNPVMKEDERGMFFADDPVIASHYGGYNYPVVTRAQNPAEVDFAGKSYGNSAPGPWSFGDVNKHIEEARKAGNDMLIFKNLKDDNPGAPGGRSIQDQYVIFDPSIVRSPFAKFDPEKMDVNNLLAAQAPVGINPFVGERKKKKKEGY